jgi:hypothetical protein
VSPRRGMKAFAFGDRNKAARHTRPEGNGEFGSPARNNKAWRAFLEERLSNAFYHILFLTTTSGGIVMRSELVEIH